MINHADLLRALSYDEATGIFIWIAPRKRVIVGTRAGTIDVDGYRVICIDQKVYRAARLAIFYKTGKWPSAEVDHENRVKDDDRYTNLRDATKSQNMSNTAVRRDSATGVKGVQFDPRRGKFYAKIIIAGVKTWLGYFATKEAAAAAYIEASKKRGEFASAI